MAPTAAEAYPSPQGAQDVLACALEYEPAGHCGQLLAPEAGCAVPAGHGEQEPAPEPE